MSRLDEIKKNLQLAKFIEMLCTNCKVRKVGEDTWRVDPCPICGHKDHFTVYEDSNRYQSFSNCCGINEKEDLNNGSIIDFLMALYKIPKEEAIKKLFEFSKKEKYEKLFEVVDNAIKNKHIKTNPNVIFNDFIDDVSQNNTDYYKKERGLNKTIKKYKLGYHKEGLNYLAKKYRLINEKPSKIIGVYKYFIPIIDLDGNIRYIISRADESDPIYKQMNLNKYHNLKGFGIRFFNDRYLMSNSIDNKVIFVTEGIFDALSFEEKGCKAIALNSANNISLFVKQIKENFNNIKETIFIICGDNDVAGENFNNQIKKELTELKIDVEIFNCYGQYKDFNEYCLKNKDSDATLEFVKYFKNKYKKKLYSNGNIPIKSVLQSKTLLKFLKKLDRNTSIPISTGFHTLDDTLNGGLYPGFYVIGGVPSIGKSTFVRQMADNIANDDINVLFFSIEMGDDELILKSISKEMFKIDPQKAASTIQILKKTMDRDLLKKAVIEYDKASNNLVTLTGECYGDKIKSKILNYQNSSKKLVLFIDYLQIMLPIDVDDIPMTNKQLIDANTTMLKQISMNYNIPVIAISSINRSNYDKCLDFESFKESGSIEYSADVIMGLQLEGMNEISKIKSEVERRKEIMRKKAKDPRPIELVILKQRNGICNVTSKFNYYTQYNYFTEK